MIEFGTFLTLHFCTNMKFTCVRQHAHASISMQTNALMFALVAYNKNEVRKAEKSLCVCRVKDRGTHIFCEVKKVT